MDEKNFAKHYEESVLILANPKSVFAYADDHTNFSSHMNKSSWMMGGGKMETKIDKGKGQKVGSHIKMNGKVFGINLYLDEVITIHKTPYQKEWQTVGDINLLVIDHYKLGFEISPEKNKSNLKVYIDYDLPKTVGGRILGYLLGEIYAKWCVKQMLNSVQKHFN